MTMLIAQISDLHLKAEGTLLFGAVDTYAMAERAITRLMALDPRPDAVVITGDLTNDGDAQDFAAVSDLLGRLAMPVCPILGNHDRRTLAVDVLAGFVPALQSDRFAYVFEMGPLRLVALDSLVEGEAHGALGDEQIGWLDQTLCKEPDRPTLVLVHHPPFDCGIGFMDSIGLKDADAFAAVVGRHAQVERVLCGHVHRAIQVRFAGTLALTAPATAHQVLFDLREGAPARWTNEPPGILLHRWDGACLVSHQIYVDDRGAPGAFSDAHTYLDRPHPVAPVSQSSVY